MLFNLGIRAGFPKVKALELEPLKVKCHQVGKESVPVKEQFRESQ